LIDRLVTEGLVGRQPAPHDRRAQLVRLTPAGKQAFEAMIPKHQDFIASRFQGISRNELAELHRLLGKLKTSFETRDHARERDADKRKDEK
jgi:DNA-binding MarR family transcriptional regulator